MTQTLTTNSTATTSTTSGSNWTYYGHPPAGIGGAASGGTYWIDTTKWINYPYQYQVWPNTISNTFTSIRSGSWLPPVDELNFSNGL